MFHAGSPGAPITVLSDNEENGMAPSNVHLTQAVANLVPRPWSIQKGKAFDDVYLGSATSLSTSYTMPK